MEHRSEARTRARSIVATISIIATTLVTTVALGAATPTTAGALPAATRTASSSLTAGANHTCAITTAGGLKCWGRNPSGQLGNGTAIDASTPTDVTGLTSGVVAVTAGGGHTCALTTGGAVSCWGDNANGQLGDGTTTSRNTPGSVPGLSSGVVAIEAGTNHTCALTDAGAVKCWGLNTSGQIGDGTTTTQTTPVNVSGLGSGVAQLSAGSSHTCVITDASGVKCWGGNNFGQLNRNGVNGLVPEDITDLSSGVASISSDSIHNCIVTTGGAAKCWGQNFNGQVGAGNVASPARLSPVVGLSSGVRSVTVGGLFSCATLTSGAAQCWGAGADGRLGTGTTAQWTSPTQVYGLSSGVAFTSAGGNHGCALMDNATLKCWGLNDGGQVGVPTSQQVLTPTTVPTLSGVAEVTGGQSATCARTTTGAVKCWGQDSSGQLGDGGTQGSITPVDVIGLSSGVTSIASGLNGSHTCAVTSSATAKCWGLGTSGQLGDGGTTSSSSPVAVSLLASVSKVGAAASSSCAITSGTIKCWGSGTSGQLGNGTSTASSTPVSVSGITSGATAIAGGATHYCAIVNGGAKCWGLGTSGQLGNNASLTSTTPVDVTGLTSGVAAIGAGSTFSCALTTDGAVRCWGAGTNGQLGTGTLVGSSVPKDVLLGAPATAIALGSSHGCAVLTDGTVKCWGLGTGGQLGRGTTNNASTPVAASGLTSVATLGMGNNHSCAISTAGDLSCWGSAAGGQVGTPATQYSPNTIPTYRFGPWNTAPVASAQSVSAPRGVGAHITLAAIDSERDPLTYSVVAGPAKGTLDCNGSFGEDCVYTAGPGQTGSDSFTFTANDGTVDSDVATVSITITNQAPIADAISASAPRGVATEIVLTGSDPNSDPYTFSKATDPSKGTVSCTSAGVCSYTAAAGSTGSDSFTFTTSDGALTSAAGTVTVTITNQVPVAEARSLEAGKHVATPVVLTAADPNGDTLTYAVVDQPAKGSVSCTGDGSDCTYTSSVNESGSDSFTFTASDGDLTSPAKTVSITLVNAAPTANDQSLQAARGVATPIVLSAADANADSLAYALADQPAKGTVTCTSAGECSYTASAGQTGTDTFTFTASDGTDTSSTGRVTITITNQAPLANAQTVAGNAPTTATPITLTGTDPNGDALTYAPTSTPTKGTLSCTGDSCTYTATAGRSGVDSFTFEVTDIGGLTSTATVTINMDNVTPGVFVGGTTYLEPESGNATYRSPFIPVMLSTPAAAPVTVWYYTVDGTAVTTGLGGDYRRSGTPTSPQSITIAAGQSTGWIQPPVFDDDLVEGTERFTVVISSLTGGASYLGTGSTPVDIIDADTVTDGRPSVFVADVDQAEGNTGSRTMGFRVTLSKAAASPTAFTCTPNPGTAQAGVDYKAGAKTVTIAAGALSAAVDITVYPNTTRQADRSFTLDCTTTSTAVNAYRTSAVGTLHDDD
ncbi:MAG: Ig-like domain-containing protein [Acidimicrobiales bacterium]